MDCKEINRLPADTFHTLNKAAAKKNEKGRFD